MSPELRAEWTAITEAQALLQEEHDRLKNQQPPNLEEHVMYRDKLHTHIDRIRAYADRLRAEHRGDTNP